MAFEVVRLEPDGVGASNAWLAEGAKTKPEEVSQPEFQFGKKLKPGTAEEETVEQKSPTEAEAKARGIKTTTAEASQILTYSAAQIEAKIPVGATIKRIKFRQFEKPVTTSLKPRLEIGTWIEEFTPGGTALAWGNGSVSEAHIAETTRATMIEKTQIRFKQPLSGGESYVAVVYLEVEFETAAEESAMSMIV